MSLPCLHLDLDLEQSRTVLRTACWLTCTVRGPVSPACCRHFKLPSQLNIVISILNQHDKNDDKIYYYQGNFLLPYIEHLPECRVGCWLQLRRPDSPHRLSVRLDLGKPLLALFLSSSASSSRTNSIDLRPPLGHLIDAVARLLPLKNPILRRRVTWLVGCATIGFWKTFAFLGCLNRRHRRGLECRPQELKV